MDSFNYFINHFHITHGRMEFINQRTIVGRFNIVYGNMGSCEDCRITGQKRLIVLIDTKNKYFFVNNEEEMIGNINNL